MTPITRQDIGMQMFNLFHKLREEFFLARPKFPSIFKTYNTIQA